MLRMRAIRKAIVFAAIVVAVSSGDRAAAAVAVRLEFAELVHRADAVAVARCVKAGPSWWEKGRIFTRYTFRLERCLAGGCRETFDVVQPGGRVGRLRQKVSGYPTFKKNDTLLLFLESWSGGMRVVGLSQGVFEKVGQGGRLIWRQRLEQISFTDGGPRPLELDADDLEVSVRRLRQRATVAR